MNARNTTTPVTPASRTPADGAESPELRRGIEAQKLPEPAGRTAPGALDWREKLWRTSRTAFWNWD